MLGVMLGCLAGAGRASAQGIEVLGTRALGMGGAFVAVADDPSAVYWNPAGFPRSGLVTLSVERQVHETGPDASAGPAALLENLQDGSASFVALGTPPVAVSYYRLRTTQLFTLPVESLASSQTRPAGLTGATGTSASLVTHNVGGTFIQSLGEYLDVATTIRFVRGVASVGARELGVDGDEALHRAADLPGHASQTVDLDLGALVAVGRVRAGVLVRNLREPSFDTTEPGVSLSQDRQVRAGVAWQSPSLSTIVACDLDLTESASARGPRRHVAIGGEQWWADRRIGARAGLRLNTIDDAEPVGSAGLSIRFTASLFVDGQITRGTSDRDRSWGIAIRYAY